MSGKKAFSLNLVTSNSGIHKCLVARAGGRTQFHTYAADVKSWCETWGLCGAGAAPCGAGDTSRKRKGAKNLGSQEAGIN